MKLKKLRKEIDRLDKRIVDLLSQRAECTLEIGKIKSKTKKDIYVPDRESQILENIIKDNKGPLTDQALRSVYAEVMSASLALEKPLKIAYLGPPATFTHLASLKKFGSQVGYVDCDSITEIFSEVEKARCDYGVVPIENSIEGAVSHTLDMFIDSPLKICSEIYLEISHNLLANCPMKNIKKVYSYPLVFGQCRMWLERNLPKQELVGVSSTTKAAQLASASRNCAAIASILAARQYKLKIIAQSIEDSAHNVTRFLVIGRQSAAITNKDRTSIMFSVKDRIGALHDMLVPFKKNRINLTKIESRPSKIKPWEYYFFVDFIGHADTKKVRDALRQLKRQCTYLKILGSYPVAK